MENLNENQLLKYAIENGIIDINTIQMKIEMNERKKYLEKHEFRVWQGKDGKWYTYVPDEMHEKGRRLIKKTQRVGIDDELVKYYKSVEEEPYFSGVFNEWVKSKLRYGEITKQTYDRYYSDYEKYIENLCAYKYYSCSQVELSYGDLHGTVGRTYLDEIEKKAYYQTMKQGEVEVPEFFVAVVKYRDGENIVEKSLYLQISAFHP